MICDLGRRFLGAFWGYGFDDIYAGMVGDLRYDDLAGICRRASRH